MPATHRTFQEPELSGFFYLETSFIGGLYLPFSHTYRRFHHECVQFLQRLSLHPDVLCVTSGWTLNEAAHLLQQRQLLLDCQAYNIQHGTSLTPEELRQQNPAILAHSYNELMRIRAHIERGCEIMAIPNTGLTDAAFNLIRDFHLRPTDAYHIATARAYDITNFVSIDRDFLRVDGITVYTCLLP
jgi:predicted nucleic acid-binding protein